MLLWLFTSLALAGNIHIEAKSPILVKLDGQYVRSDPSARIVIDSLEPGKYNIEIVNLVGNIMAHADVSVAFEEEIYFSYADKRLDRVQDHVLEELGDEFHDPALQDFEFRNLMRKTLKGSLTKKLKQVAKRTAGYSVDVRQVDELLTSFHKREERLQVVVMLKDAIRDGQNAPALDHHFGVETDRLKMRELFEE